jgi:hypothetical protein
MRERLEERAAETGRSITQEAELRLEQGFATESLLAEALALAYGPKLAGLLLEAGDLLTEVGRSVAFDATNTLEGAENWLSHPLAYAEAVKALAAILEEGFRPAGEIVPLPRQLAPPGHPDMQRVLDQMTERPGLGRAMRHVALLTGEIGAGGEIGEKAATKRKLLGDLIDRLKSNNPNRKDD